MSVISNPPYPSYFDVDGSPLENGYLYFGAANQNPETNPITVYWDSAYLVPAAQPIRTSGGFAVRNGSPANVYVTTDYSLTVRDKNRRLVYSKLLSEGQTTAEVNIQFSTQTVIATSGQTVFNLSTAYTPGNQSLAVYHNGARLVVAQDYTETSATVVTLLIGATVGDVLQFVTATPINPSSLGAAAVAYVPAGAGAVATNVQTVLRETVSVTRFGAVGDGVTDDTAKIQAALDYVFNAGGGTVLIPKSSASYKVSDTLTIRSNTRVEFEDWVELTTASSTGTVLFLDGDNIELINPLIDGGGSASDAGENGIGIVSGNNVQVRGGKVRNCARGGVGMAFGGKGVQIETGDVEGVLIDGTQFSYCFMAMSTVRDGSNVNADYGILFSNIKADNCDILFFVKQANINNTNGLEHTVQLNNFYAVNCGAFEGVMQFSRAANVQVSNGVVVNSPLIAATPLIRGNHRFCRFDNIRFSGNCPQIIDLDPSTFAIDTSHPCENNTYDINHSGTAGHIANASVTTTNRILADCVIRACLDSDVTTKLVGDELRNGYCRLELQQGNRTIITTTGTAYLESRTNFASFPQGISVMRFNSSQIAFPATQIASTDANTLDDYEEGTWTLTDNSGANLTFAAAYGDYIKIGRMVFASFAVTYPTTASGANASIGGIPFTTASTGGRVTCGLAIGYTDQGSFMSASANPSSNSFVLATASGGLLTNANMSNKTLRGVFSYMANA